MADSGKTCATTGDKTNPGPTALAIGVAGGALFLIVVWFATALVYIILSLVAFIWADAFYRMVRVVVPEHEADFLWWLAVIVLMAGMSYGAKMALEFVGETFQPKCRPQTPAELFRARRMKRDYDPTMPPKTGPSPEEIARQRRGG